MTMPPVFEQELKLEVLAHGIRVTDAAKREWEERYCGPLTLAEYASTSGVALHTLSGVWLNAPYLEPFAVKNAQVELDFDGGDFLLVWQGESATGKPTPLP